MLLNDCPVNIKNKIEEFCSKAEISSELIDFWQISDYGVFVSRSEKFYKNLNYKKGDPSFYINSPPDILDPADTNDSRRLISILYNHIFRNVGKEPTILDIGGYIGRFSIECAKYLKWLGSKKLIYIFEPGLTTPLIYANLLLNKVDKYVEVENLAVSNKSGIETYSLNKDVMISGSIVESSTSIQKDLSFEVTTVAALEFLREKGINEPLLVKIDTEGLEAQVIDGFIGYDELPSSIFIIEFWQGYLNYKISDKSFADYIHNNYEVFNIKSSLYPSSRGQIDNLRTFAKNFDYSKGNIDLMLLPRNMSGLTELKGNLKEASLI